MPRDFSGDVGPEAGGIALSIFERIQGGSEAAAEIRAFGMRAATVDATVLLTGESGTGKGILARAIHEASSRSRSAFIAVNCASVPESLFETEFFGHARGAFTGAHQTRRGLLEQANGGTLFLDEIGELSPALQAKLLTAIEDREFRRVGGERSLRVDIRLIAATSADLDAEVAAGRFRRDLFHRLLVLAYRLPPLRDRGRDAKELASRFLARFADRYDRAVQGFDPAALDRLRAYPWPGNIRQLANTVEAAVLACEHGRVRACHLPSTLLTAATAWTGLPAAPGANASAPAPVESARTRRPRYTQYGDPLEERRRIEEVLRRWRGNKTRAAIELGMARNTLRARLRAWEREDRASAAGNSRDRTGRDE